MKELWDGIYSKNASFFGNGPSGFCLRCLDMVPKDSKTVLELGPGQGRDTSCLASSGMDITAIEYSGEACKQLRSCVQCANIIQADLKEHFNFGEFDVCYSHMVLTMDFTEKELKRIMYDIFRSVRPGGVVMFSVRNTDDPWFEKGMHLHDDVWETEGFAVNYFSEERIRELCNDFEILSIFRFEEGPLPKRLFGVVLKRPLK